MSVLATYLTEMLERTGSAEKTGMVETGVPGVSFFWSRGHLPRQPLVYNAGIVIVGQGYKVGYLGDRRFRYDEETLLLLGVPLPFECETHGTQAEPVLGIRIDLDMSVLHGLVAKLGARPSLDGPDSSEPASALEPVPMSDDLVEATARLLAATKDPVDRRVLGEAAVNEVVYRILRGRYGRVLYDLTQHGTPYAAVARALEIIHTAYKEALSVDDLAKENAMSVSSFHRAFKKVTGDSPLQYLKKIRLDKAMGLLMYEGLQVNAAAYEVGYESPSQFSREFKRHFNISPSQAQA